MCASYDPIKNVVLKQLKNAATKSKLRAWNKRMMLEFIAEKGIDKDVGDAYLGRLDNADSLLPLVRDIYRAHGCVPCRAGKEMKSCKYDWMVYLQQSQRRALHKDNFSYAQIQK